MVSDSNELSREDQLRAELIYNCAQYVGWGLWFVAILVVAVIQGYTARYFPPMRGSDGWMGGTAILPMLLIPRFAASRVKRAGISRERVESRVVPKSFAQFGGEPFALHTRNAVPLGWFMLAFSGAMLALIVWIQRSGQPASPIFAVTCALFFAALGANSLYLMSNPPVLQLDAAGVKGYFNGFLPRRVTWQEVVAIEIQQAFDFRGKPTLKTLVFVNGAGKPLIKAPLAPSFVKAADVEGVIARVEAKLRGEV